MLNRNVGLDEIVENDEDSNLELTHDEFSEEELVYSEDYLSAISKQRRQQKVLLKITNSTFKEVIARMKTLSRSRPNLRRGASVLELPRTIELLQLAGSNAASKETAIESNISARITVSPVFWPFKDVIESG